MTDEPDWVREFRRVLNAAKLPEYMSDLVEAVPTDLVRQIVGDFRSYNPAPRSLTPPATVQIQGAGRVVSADDAPVASTGTGWTEAPKVDAWRPPGVDLCDKLMDAQDAIDKAERIRQLAEASAVRRAEAEIRQREEEELKKRREEK